MRAMFDRLQEIKATATGTVMYALGLIEGEAYTKILEEARQQQIAKAALRLENIVPGISEEMLGDNNPDKQSGKQ
jgi:hypothetical protein